MTVTPIYPRPLKENIIPSLARDFAEVIKRGLESGKFKVINGTIVLGEQEESHERRTGRV